MFQYTEDYASDPEGKYLRIPPNISSSTPSNMEITVEVRMRGTSESLSISASKELEMNQPPKGGDLNISPSSGIAMFTPFTFLAVSWVDDHLPLSYSLFYSLSDPNIIAKTNIWKLVVQKTSTGNDLGNAFILPQGNALNSYIVYIKLRVADVFGVSTELIKEIIVSPYPTEGILGKSLFDVAKELVDNVPANSPDLVLQVNISIIVI